MNEFIKIGILFAAHVDRSHNGHGDATCDICITYIKLLAEIAEEQENG